MSFRRGEQEEEEMRLKESMRQYWLRHGTNKDNDFRREEDQLLSRERNAKQKRPESIVHRLTNDRSMFLILIDLSDERHLLTL